MKVLKKLPKFKSEADEREFWLSHDSADYLDWSKARFVDFVNLKPTSRSISIRLPEHMLSRIKALANREDVPYQSYMKILIAQKLEEITYDFIVHTRQKVAV